jgi:hypothetical protein
LGLSAAAFLIEKAQVVVHAGHQPDLPVDFFDAGLLTGEYVAEIDLALADADTPGAEHEIPG